MDKNPLSAGKDYHLFYGLSLHLPLLKLLSVKLSQFSVVGLNYPWAKGILVRSSFRALISCREVPIFFPSNFSIFQFILKCLILLELIFVQGDGYGGDFIHLHVDAQVSQHFN